jgi:protein SCO1/2
VQVRETVGPVQQAHPHAQPRQRQAQFDRHAIGLTGNESAIAALARRYRVAYQIERPDPAHPDAPYEVSHSRGIYAFDQHGKAVWLAPDSESQEDLLAAIRPMLR